MNLNLMVFIQGKIYLVKDGAYVINLDEFKSIGVHWRALCVNSNNATYFGSFAVD